VSPASPPPFRPSYASVGRSRDSVAVYPPRTFMKRSWFVLPFLILGSLVPADEPPLPFDPGAIHRYSLDGVPRSLSIRQGENRWLGYDLERGTPFRVWTAKPGSSGLIVDGFTARSQGEPLFADSSDSTWRLLRGGEAVETSLRYLACSDRGDAIELRWEIRHEGVSVAIRERVPRHPEGDPTGCAVRLLEVDGLAPGCALLPPKAVTGQWMLLDAGGAIVDLIARDGPYRLLLP